MYYNPGTNSYVPVPLYSTTADTKQNIQAILDKRKVHEKTLSDTGKDVKKLSQTFESFNGAMNRSFPDLQKVTELMDRGGFAEKAPAFWEALSKIKEVDAKQIQANVKSVAKDIQNAATRFSRRSICVAVVGNSGEGKSTLIQKITGLKEDTVPTSSGGICTATRSTIRNSPEFRAVITFLTKEELIHGVIKPYFDHLNIKADLFNMEDVKWAFHSIPAQQLDQYYTRLSLYVEHYADYEDLLDSPPTTLYDPKELRQYVSQRDSISQDMQYYNFLAVQSVEIDCPFPDDRIGNLVLVDTVGVNEPTIDIKNKMFQTIKDSADFVLYVKGLSENRAKDFLNDDAKLYYDIFEEMNHVEAHRWVFCVLNYFKKLDPNHEAYDRNLRNITEMVGAPQKRPGAIMEVDCSDDQQVSENLIAPMLAHLSAHIGEIDAALIRHINEKLASLNNDIAHYSSVLDQLKLPSGNAGDLEITATTMAIGEMIEKLNADWNAYKEQLLMEPENDTWRDKAKSMVQELKSKLPSIEQINGEFSRSNSALLSIERSYENARAEIRRIYDGDPFGFMERAQITRQDCANLFLNASGLRGEMGLAEDESVTLPLIIARLLTSASVAGLKDEFKTVDAFRLNHIDDLRRQMDKALQCMDPNNGNGNIPATWTKDSFGEKVFNVLASLTGEVRQSMMGTIDSLISPVDAAINTMAAFVGNMAGQKVKDEWRIIFQPRIRRLKPELFEKVGGYQRVAEDWNTTLTALSSANIPLMTFR
jgi:GTPase Era involved in 16S rRNA processing